MDFLSFGTLVPFIVAIVVIWTLFQVARVVPQRENFVVERLGKYSKTLSAGFHILVPFVDRVAYKHSLKEQAIDVPSQSCITRDNIAVEIDGILYVQVVDAQLASYGIENYFYATSQLAQTTLRSEIGKIELDRTFEERDLINAQVVAAVDALQHLFVRRGAREELLDQSQRAGFAPRADVNWHAPDEVDELQRRGPPPDRPS